MMPTQETRPADSAERSAILPVHDIIAIVREWVDLHTRHLPDFAGAYLWGESRHCQRMRRFTCTAMSMSSWW
jgi:hypothetical protein